MVTVWKSIWYIAKNPGHAQVRWPENTLWQRSTTLVLESRKVCWLLFSGNQFRPKNQVKRTHCVINCFHWSINCWVTWKTSTPCGSPGPGLRTPAHPAASPGPGLRTQHTLRLSRTRSEDPALWWRNPPGNGPTHQRHSPWCRCRCAWRLQYILYQQDYRGYTARCEPLISLRQKGEFTVC